MRIIVADCSAEYTGRLRASLPMAKRVVLIKADNSVLIFSELGSYKPLNWMVGPCTIKDITEEKAQAATSDRVEETEQDPQNDPAQQTAQTAQNKSAEQSEQTECDTTDTDPADSTSTADSAESALPETGTTPEKIIRAAAAKSNDVLEVTFWKIYSDETHDLGEDPGLTKDGVEDQLQQYLAEQIERIGEGARLVRREYPTAIGPVDIMAIDGNGQHVAIEIKRHGGIDGVEQLTRYVDLLNRDPLLAPVRGMFAAQTIAPQAKTLAEDRGFETLILDYDEMRGYEDGTLRLF